MRIYNTFTRRKEEFVPRQAGKVAMYVCGPTVYNHIHIGNARTFLCFDVVRRYLEYRGYDVTFVQNITDLDDKIINRAVSEGRQASELAAEYTECFIEVMHRFGIKDPDIRPRATREIPEMIALVQRLIERGHAYEIDGDVYFAVRSFKSYGALSGRNIDELRAGARVDVDERKRDPLDFALWKAAKDGEPFWESPWGKGRPGWHLECSTMAEKYLGLPLDIHGGGSDLCFPHHENERAQSQAASDSVFVNYWMHSGMLNINEEKMSKSLGNFLLLKDVLEYCNPMALRVLMLQTHYRSPLDFSDERLKEASASYGRLCASTRNLSWAAALDKNDQTDEDGTCAQALSQACHEAKDAFIASMDDDFNTAGALGAIFILVGKANSFLDSSHGMGDLQKKLAQQAFDTISELLSVLGISLPESYEQWPQEVCELAAKLCDYAGSDSHEAVFLLLKARQAARQSKDWTRADAVRDGLAALGFNVEDTENGARLHYVGNGVS